MGTRSTIALEFADGTVQQVYAHFDGYLEGNGQTLFDHYSDPFKLRDLIDLGDLSSLDAEVHIPEGVDHNFDSTNTGITTFYGRDRGEEGTEAARFKDFEDYKANHGYQEYEYILRQIDGKAVWFVCTYNGEYEELGPVLAKINKPLAA
jgi:hypothetical protein